jgi:5'(3')-deoxyribonucleotidase
MIEKIYIDMDGVLADFDRGVEEICGVARPEPGKSRTWENDNLMWERMRFVEHFYNKLEPMPGAVDMFSKLWKLFGDRVEILSGIPNPKRGIEKAGDDKICWAHRFLCEDLKVNIVYRAEKANFCKGKDYILIDDLVVNIKEWEEKGGTGILHKSPELTLLQLDCLL